MANKWLPKMGIDEVKDSRIIFKLFAELLGTMILTFFACGSAHTQHLGGNSYLPPDVVRYSLTFGFTVATMAQVSSTNVFWYNGLD